MSETKLNASTIADFPVDLAEVKDTEGKGRGLFAKKEIKAGTKLLETTPLISVLDNQNLLLRCSHCFIRPEDDSELEIQELAACSVCNIVQYCGPTCQQADWIRHKRECQSLLEFEKNQSSGGKEEGGVVVPDTPIRGVARLLGLMDDALTAELNGAGRSELWAIIDAMPSIRSTWDEATQELNLQFSLSLSKFVGQDLVNRVFGQGHTTGAGGLLDLVSRFTTNSFTLTTPQLDAIGVTFTPLPALLNHSCRPNAVLIPSSRSETNPKSLKIHVLKNIQPGEEISLSYIDCGAIGRKRREELKSGYGFTCACELCVAEQEGRKTGDFVDPREALECTKEGCDGVAWIPDLSGEEEQVSTVCNKCKDKMAFNRAQFVQDLQTCEEKLDQAEAGQFENAEESLKILLEIEEKLRSYRMSVATPPLLHCLQLQSMIHIRNMSDNLPIAQSIANIIHSGTCKLYPTAHPARGISAAMIAKLQVLEAPPSVGEGEFWTSQSKLQRTTEAIMLALQEAATGFGEGKFLTEMETMLNEWWRAVRYSAMIQHRGGKPKAGHGDEGDIYEQDDEEEQRRLAAEGNQRVVEAQ